MTIIQEKLIELIKDYKALRNELSKVMEQINLKGRELINELQEVDGWECLIQSCEEHLKTYPTPNDFFDICSITHTNKAIQVVKGYSDGSEYKVLEISLYNSLAMQVHNRLIEIKAERQASENSIKEKELAELKRLKEKYENL